ncbi:sigma-70 family RNA polymerase sigma factor [Intrasporangium sp. YIM S08009]|uniref:sigma-70 family RNA polymerase sigma factor n=1 Tax=Intrasporangium zincisolvens TaxID=3080018 RepID=UPI002B05314D|nr:sigma-70 family RNA polymerase sigma factor [Intrasporangium sp. YIM S08009]
MDTNPGPTPDWLAGRFEEHRGHLRAVAYRVLGSPVEADDAVQEAWLRLSRTDTSDVANLGGWLTTVVARISLDMLRSRSARREHLWDAADAEALGGAFGDAPAAPVGGTRPPDPAAEAELADSVGLALLVVLDTLAPAERLAFVLHDLFGLPFEEIADVVDRSPAATRQLASRARRRVRASDVDLDAERVDDLPGAAAPASRTRQRDVVEAFLAASRGGDFARLLELLDPGVVVRSDAAAALMGSPAEVRGPEAVAAMFDGRARGARLATLDGRVGAVWMLHGVPKVVFAFTVEGGRVVGIDLLADEARLDALAIDYL